MLTTVSQNLKTIAQLPSSTKSEWKKNFDHYPNLRPLVKHELINNLEVDTKHLDDLDTQINLLLPRSSLLLKIQEDINNGSLPSANHGYDLFIKLGGIMTESETQLLRSSLLSSIQEQIKKGSLSNANSGYDLFIKLGGTLAESETQLLRSSLLSKIQQEINDGSLSSANDGYDLFIKLGGVLKESEIQSLRSSLPLKIQEKIDNGNLSEANSGYDLFIKLGGTLEKSETQLLRSSLLSIIQEQIKKGNLSEANSGYDLFIKLGGTTQINTHLSEYFNKNQVLISLYHPLTPKSLFDLDYFDTFAQSYPFIIEKKDQYKQTIDTHYDAIRSAYMKKSSIEVWKILQGGYPPDEKAKVDKLIEYFGEKAIYKYLAQGTRDPHDAVQYTDELIQMYETEYGEQKKKLFVDTILTQSGSSAVGYYELNNFLIQYKPDRRELLDTELKADDTLTDQRFIGLVESIQGKESSGSLLTSRANLYQLGDLLYLLSQKPALKTIEQLQYSGNPNDRILYEYFATGILSERKKDIQAMLMMYTDPEQFLGLDDKNLNNINKLKPLHDAKKPQIMVTDFNHIDMTPADLISALPLGVYDTLTYFKPMTQTYITDRLGNISTVDISSTLEQQEDQHLSSLGNKLLQKLLQDYNNTHKNNRDTMSFKQLQGGLSILPPTQQSWIREQLDMKRYTAQIAPKSDISNRYNGFNCDSLGVKHGKKVVMMFNPLCADFCLFDDLPSDKVDNLIATSWLTLNRSIPENIADIKSKIIANEDPRKLFDQSVTKNPDEYILTLDNIEADENFAEKTKKDHKKKELLQKIYTLFFSTYIQQHPLSPKGVPISTTKINCGTSYGKIDLWSDTEDNNFLPLLLNSYSDNTERETLKIFINAGEQGKTEAKTGIQSMSIEDILSVIYLEGLIYPVGLKDHINNIQHHILASMINNELKQRENLSLVSYDNNKRINGYLLAYQGVMDKKNNNDPCVYVHDVVVDDTGKGKGGEMMKKLFEKAKKLDLPILASLREGTSYKIITKKIESLGYTITQDKQRPMGGETFHDVVIEKKLVG